MVRSLCQLPFLERNMVIDLEHLPTGVPELHRLVADLVSEHSCTLADRDGSNHWRVAHCLDATHLFGSAPEAARAGPGLRAAADDGASFPQIAGSSGVASSSAMMAADAGRADRRDRSGALFHGIGLNVRSFRQASITRFFYLSTGG